MAQTTQAQTLDPELEQQVLTLWPTLSTEERSLWLRVLDTLLPPNATLRVALAAWELPAAAGTTSTVDDEDARSPAATIARLSLQGPPPPRYRNWEETIGMFAHDPVMDAILDAGRHIRESERTEEC
ncbi:MAG: hypothetical protein M3Z04_14480 [Chloroflexota bacterium]|nr:hypothetical protein [Chloroflexota bacterium]